TKVYTYDGLGRLTSEQQVREPPGYEDGQHGWVFNTVRVLIYDPFPQNGVTEHLPVKWGALDSTGWHLTNQTSTHKPYDGLGRLFQSFVSVTGASSPEQGGQPNEVHSYSYDYRGNLVAARDPDPTNDSNPPVVHNFFYDDRNRLIQVQPPTGSPLQVSYDAWQ